MQIGQNAKCTRHRTLSMKNLVFYYRKILDIKFTYFPASFAFNFLVSYIYIYIYISSNQCNYLIWHETLNSGTTLPLQTLLLKFDTAIPTFRSLHLRYMDMEQYTKTSELCTNVYLIYLYETTQAEWNIPKYKVLQYSKLIHLKVSTEFLQKDSQSSWNSGIIQKVGDMKFFKEKIEYIFVIFFEKDFLFQVHIYCCSSFPFYFLAPYK